MLHTDSQLFSLDTLLVPDQGVGPAPGILSSIYAAVTCSREHSHLLVPTCSNAIHVVFMAGLNVLSVFIPISVRTSSFA